MADMAIQGMIYEIRGQRVMLDRDLAKLYGVETKNLNKTVSRNIKRFPADFMFQLTTEELSNLRFQFGTSSLEAQGEDLRFQNGTANEVIPQEEDNLKFQSGTSSWGGVRYNPYAFTEQGIAMLSGLLNSDTAIEVNISIMRAFVQLRHYVLAKPDTNGQIAELRKLLMLHIENSDHKFSEHDEAIRQIILALNKLLEQPKQSKRIGFNAD